jgi:glycosyltransferase involved in cell wall biosynthesis
VAQKYGVETSVEWRGQLARAELIKLYSGNTALVFPSLHDSSGNVVMEALSQGLPVICLDLGGPGALLPDNCGIKIAARERTEEQVVSALAEAMKRVANDSELRSEFAANALAEARRQTWESVVSRAYKEIDKVLAKG